ncbi:PadR family transcriptional regulator [Neobacillus sp. NPDC058068]|uniref:PadR family transcriptional regulator n=1 Tax=Neobacillus sp. NPDC058068 TaxID=3346325 RepID=UPI0036D95D03
MSTTQMLKGIIDGCLLAIIHEKEVYGYELAEKLEQYGFDSFSEGTIYPLLMRMQKEELVSSTLKKSTAGPKRKYYTLTQKGEEELQQFIARWEKLQSNVNHCLRKQRT